MPKNFLTLIALFLVAFAKAQMPSDSLMFWMPYDGNPNDTSVHQLPVLYNSNTSYVDDRFGRSNSAIYFDGNAFVQMDDSSYLDYSVDEEFSAGLWVKVELDQPTYTQNAIFSIDSDCSDFRYSFQLIDSDKFLFANAGSAITGDHGCWNFYERSCSFEEWVHLAVVGNHTMYKMYVNGALVQTVVLNSISYAYHPSQMMIGAWRSRGSTSTNGYFRGAVDDVFAFNRALTDDEVYDIYNYTPVSTQSVNSSSLTYFPNPSSDNVTFSFPNNTGTMIVTNLLGEEVYNEIVNTDRIQLNVNGWTRGLYLVTYKSGSETVTSKLMVK